ncbi:hypothetical protein MKX01_008312 [Papaver californicum]|nr:hypothetical protein MKX01_008312 [Papaver californicum]
MSGVEVNGGNKRQLPSRMLGVTKTEQTQKPKRKSENISSSDIQRAPKVLKPKRIPLAKKEVVGISEDSELKVDSNVLVKCKTRKGRTASERLDLDDEDEVNDDDNVGLRKKRTKKRIDVVGSKIQLSTTSKTIIRKASEVGDRDECLVTSPSEEDRELTVEDLMTIAEEVGSKTQLPTTSKKRNRKANKVGDRDECLVSSPNEEDVELTVEDLMTIAEESAAKDSEPTKLPVSFEFSRKDSGGSIEAIETSKYCTVSMKETSTSTLTKNNRESSEDGATIISSQSRTGDSTQDMLDLFLGPLLKIPQTGGERSESVAEDFNLACEFRKHKRNQVVGEEVVPLTKKKSSLKDRVAMFFD